MRVISVRVAHYFRMSYVLSASGTEITRNTYGNNRHLTRTAIGRNYLMLKIISLRLDRLSVIDKTQLLWKFPYELPYELRLCFFNSKRI